MSDSTLTVRCAACGFPLASSFRGECPSCHGVRRVYEKYLHGSLALSGSLAWSTTREYVERNWVLLIIDAVITISSSFVGLFLFGWSGVFVGLIAGAVSHVVSGKASKTVRHAREGTNP